MKTIHLRYFALLRDQAGRSEETLSTSATTARLLYEELASRYRFTLPAARVRAAINGEFASDEQPLREGDAVVFIPPVSGG